MKCFLFLVESLLMFTRIIKLYCLIQSFFESINLLFLLKLYFDYRYLHFFLLTISFICWENFYHNPIISFFIYLSFNQLFLVIILFIFLYFFFLSFYIFLHSMTKNSTVKNVIKFTNNSAKIYKCMFMNNDYKFYECFYKFIKSIIINLN